MIEGFVSINGESNFRQSHLRQSWNNIQAKEKFKKFNIFQSKSLKMSKVFHYDLVVVS